MLKSPNSWSDIGMKPKAFWAEVDRLSCHHKADKILMYMRLMLEKARAANVPVRLKDFHNRGGAITLFQGVQSWFGRINEYGKDEGVRVKQYIVSSGNAELIEGTSVASKFEKVYASRFMFDRKRSSGLACPSAELHHEDTVSVQNQQGHLTILATILRSTSSSR